MIAGKLYREVDSIEVLETFSIDRIQHIADYADQNGFYGKNIAILILDEYLEFNSHVSPICIDYDESPSETVESGSIDHVAGWQTTEPNGENSLLRSTELPLSIQDQVSFHL